MSVFDFVYLTFALLSGRLWFPALRRFCREIWELGDPSHGAGAETLLDHRSQIYPTGALRAPEGREAGRPEGTRGFQRKAPGPRRDLSTRRRWEGGFGRRGL